jgi:probable F420-dependent oxidoreductase
MKYGISIIIFGSVGDPRVLASLARDAEEAGWDGFFTWDHIAFPWPVPIADVTVSLAAAAAATQRIRLGAMVTPVPRRRPWKLAREMAALDHLSGGRVIMGVGIGGVPQEFDDLGEETDPRVRGVMLDEALAVITGLWSGEPFSFEGEHYRVRGAQFLPGPVQQPRIPVWVGGGWPNRRPFVRAARWDGVFPVVPDGGPDDLLSPEEIGAVREFVAARRDPGTPFDIVATGHTPGHDLARGAEIVAPYIEAGATWWAESIHGLRFEQTSDSSTWELDAMRERIQQGPPRP